MVNRKKKKIFRHYNQLTFSMYREEDKGELLRSNDMNFFFFVISEKDKIMTIKMQTAFRIETTPLLLLMLNEVS